MNTAAGKYRTRISIRRATRTLNSMNEPEVSYTREFCSRWAYIEPTSGREFTIAQTTHANLLAILRVRSDSKTREIATDMAVVYSGRTLNISAVFDETALRKEVVIYCTEAL